MKNSLAFALLAAAGAIAGCTAATADSRPNGGPSGRGGAGGSGTGGSGGASGDAGTSSTGGATGTAGSGNGGALGSGGASGGAAGQSGDAGAAGQATCGAPGLEICDGFESAAVGGPPDPGVFGVELQNPEESIAIDDSRAHSGLHSLRVRAGTGYERAIVSAAKPFPFAARRFHVRAFVYYASDPKDAHFTFFTGVGRLPGATQPTFVRYGGQFGILMANYFGHNAADQPQYSSSTPGNYSDGVAMPRDRWACMEALYDGAAHELRFWLDDSEITRLHVTAWSPAPPDPQWSPVYEKVEIGWEAYGGQGETEIWYDDVAIGSERIGCAP